MLDFCLAFGRLQLPIVVVVIVDLVMVYIIIIIATVSIVTIAIIIIISLSATYDVNIVNCIVFLNNTQFSSVTTSVLSTIKNYEQIRTWK